MSAGDALGRLKLREAASVISGTSTYDRTPVLVIDKCLAGAENQLVAQVKANVEVTGGTVFETIAVPKRGFGPRPMTVLCSRDRVLYEALVDQIKPHLPVSERTKEDWAAHQNLGLGDDVPAGAFVVDIDIAACYEYINHDLLSEELLLQAAQHGEVKLLKALLGATFQRTQGLPQLLAASDLLADTFLVAIERELVRYGMVIARYADDFRILVTDLREANDAVERTADVARAWGLALSSNKTMIRSVESLRRERDERNEFQERYRDDAVEALTTIDFFEWEYGEVEFDVPPEEEEALQAASHQMIIDWNSDDESQKALLTELLSLALKTLSNAPNRVTSQRLVRIAETHPLKLQNVCQYILARKSEAESWGDLARLADLGRQSPWAKLHILTTAGQLDPTPGDEFDALMAWATTQLADRHETVRAEAAWLLAKLVPDAVAKRLPAIFQIATALSRPALAAAAARALGGARPGAAEVSMRDDGALTKAAWKWGLTA